MEVTLLELHLPDAEFNAPYSRGTDAEPAEIDVDDQRGGSSRLGPLVALVGLAGLALLARYLRGSEAEQATFDEVEA